jgi:hypothetical protein
VTIRRLRSFDRIREQNLWAAGGINKNFARARLPPKILFENLSESLFCGQRPNYQSWHWLLIHIHICFRSLEYNAVNIEFRTVYVLGNTVGLLLTNGSVHCVLKKIILVANGLCLIILTHKHGILSQCNTTALLWFPWKTLYPGGIRTRVEMFYVFRVKVAIFSFTRQKVLISQNKSSYQVIQRSQHGLSDD